MRTTANGRTLKPLATPAESEPVVQPQKPQVQLKKKLPMAALTQSHKFKLNP